MRKNSQLKHIFCLEGNWESDLRDLSSVRPALELLSKRLEVQYIHRGCGTAHEFKHYLKKWAQKKYAHYPILYLSFHGEEGRLLFDDGEFPIEEVADLLEGKCSNRLVIFDSCSTLHIDLRLVKRFLKTTEALAVIGYKTDVDWLSSTALALLVMEAVQDNEFSGKGIGAIRDKVLQQGERFKELGLRIVTKKDL
jgi:hypothetical protein